MAFHPQTGRNVYSDLQSRQLHHPGPSLRSRWCKRIGPVRQLKLSTLLPTITQRDNEAVLGFLSDGHLISYTWNMQQDATDINITLQSYSLVYNGRTDGYSLQAVAHISIALPPSNTLQIPSARAFWMAETEDEGLGVQHPMLILLESPSRRSVICVRYHSRSNESIPVSVSIIPAAALHGYDRHNAAVNAVECLHIVLHCTEGSDFLDWNLAERITVREIDTDTDELVINLTECVHMIRYTVATDLIAEPPTPVTHRSIVPQSSSSARDCELQYVHDSDKFYNDDTSFIDHSYTSHHRLNSSSDNDDRHILLTEFITIKSVRTFVIDRFIFHVDMSLTSKTLLDYDVRVVDCTEHITNGHLFAVVATVKVSNDNADSVSASTSRSRSSSLSDLIGRQQAFTTNVYVIELSGLLCGLMELEPPKTIYNITAAKTSKEALLHVERLIASTSLMDDDDNYHDRPVTLDNTAVIQGESLCVLTHPIEQIQITLK